MNLISFLLQTSRAAIIIVFFTAVISGFSSIFLIALINEAVNKKGTVSSFQIWTFIGLLAVSFITNFITQVLLAEIAETSIYKLRLRLSTKILSCPLQHLEELGSNRLLATLTHDTGSIAMGVSSLPFFLINITVIIGCLVYLIWLSQLVFLVTVITFALGTILVQFLFWIIVKFDKLAREEQDSLFKDFRSIIDGVKELKLHRYRQNTFLSEYLQKTAASLLNYRVAASKFFAIATSYGELQQLILLALVVFALPQVLPVNNQLFSGYVLTLTYLTRAVQTIVQNLSIFSQANVALQKIDKLGFVLSEQAEDSLLLQFPSGSSSYQIDFIQLTHSYHNKGKQNNFEIGPIDLTINSGELVFIVGKNGSGKSTLAKLITGLYIPEKGKILLNGQPITDQNREAYRQLFTAIFSDFYLFNRILGLNLKNLDDKAYSYLKKFGLNHKVEVHDGIFSTIDLSQGQRKRLALLIAFLENRPIYLFDEWASDQDPYFREIFYKEILMELKAMGKIVLVISHDDRYFYLADKIVKLG
ncbi:MAG: cyclic peptide export ABC transporter [Scytonematopsis contorta HA4267-MV1]|jgi:putative ATP-binding cassette transporter|nr:cyclic peptide export ABC transporter [Scytonematopsis contorta HA4267-MV1]